MPERTLQNCNRYLDRLARLVEHASGYERTALLTLAARLMREMQEAQDQEDVMRLLTKRLNPTPTSKQQKLTEIER